MTRTDANPCAHGEPAITGWREHLGDRRVVASISGGKDSAAMSLWLTEQGIEHDRVHLLTGWDSDITMDYLRGELARVIGPIVEVAGTRLMEDLIAHKGMFPSKARRFCTEELKIRPMQRFLNARVEAGEDVVNAVGIRASESTARSNLTEWEWSDGFDCEVWRPLLRWSERDVIEIHRRHGLPPNPLYLKGASRVGCWPCIHARKSEIKMIADVDPGRILLIRDLEGRTRRAARERWVRRVEAWNALPIDEKVNRRAAAKNKDRAPHSGDPPTRFYPPTWFQSPLGGGDTWPIDRVVAWSRTLRGGKVENTQEELFANHNPGCMRWGLCETDVTP